MTSSNSTSAHHRYLKSYAPAFEDFLSQINKVCAFCTEDTTNIDALAAKLIQVSK
jgi:hypothetical protein